MIIGLLGRSRVGKDTVASYLIELLGQEHTVLMRLSRPLKDAVQALYGFSYDQVEHEQKEHIDPRYGVTPRTCIQELCTHMMKLHGVDFFSKQMFAKYDTGLFEQKCVIIPDIRYEHDLGYIRDRGGIVIKIERRDPSVPVHVWETHIDALQGNYLIRNETDKHDLHKQVSQIVHNMKLSSQCL